jgi:2'-5' RNA ligase
MMLRSFIGVEIPLGIQSAVAISTAALQKALPKPLIRWVLPRNVHLTLKFLGDVAPIALEEMTEALKSEVITCGTFTMSIGGLGAFPSSHRPRVIWVGLDSPAELIALQRDVEAVTAQHGIPSEGRPFSPHLTIGRVGQNHSRQDFQLIQFALEGTAVGTLGKVCVEAVHIFKSDLQPGGPVYTVLHTLPLKSAP